MFRAAIGKLITAAGEDSLLPVKDLNTSHLYRPLNVVLKQRRRWFWQSAKYNSTPFQIKDLLLSSEPLQAPITTEILFSDYEDISGYDIKGKIGASLATIVDVNFDLMDTISVVTKFHQINKTNVNLQELIVALENRSLDLDHSFIKQVMENPRNVLCVVIAALVNDVEGQLTCYTDINAQQKLNLKINIPEESVSAGHIGFKSQNIPADTPLAVSVCEIYVNGSNGNMELIVTDNLSGGFDEVDSALQMDPSVQEMFNGIINLPTANHKIYTKIIQEICKVPKSIDPLLILLKVACRAHFKEKPLPSETLDNLILKIGKDNLENWKELLGIVGFSFHDSGSVNFPEQSDVLESSRCLFEALIELSDQQLLSLAAINSNIAKSLIHVLENTIKKVPLPLEDSCVNAIYSTPGEAQNFLSELDYQTEKVNSKLCLKSLTKVKNEIEAAYRVCFALWEKL